METLKFDPESERRLAARIEALAEKLEKISSGLTETAEGVSSAWKSDNSSSYVEKCSVLAQSISATSKDLVSVGADARAESDAVARAEEAAKDSLWRRGKR